MDALSAGAATAQSYTLYSDLLQAQKEGTFDSPELPKGE